MKLFLVGILSALSLNAFASPQDPRTVVQAIDEGQETVTEKYDGKKDGVSIFYLFDILNSNPDCKSNIEKLQLAKLAGLEIKTVDLTAYKTTESNRVGMSVSVLMWQLNSGYYLPVTCKVKAKSWEK